MHEEPMFWIRLNSKYCSNFKTSAPYKWIKENAPWPDVYIGYNIKYVRDQPRQLHVFIDENHELVAAQLKMMFG